MKAFFTLLALLAFLPVLILGSLAAQRLAPKAAKPPAPASVAINHGEISTYLSNVPTQLSALAYDAAGRPIWEGLIYEWGISSTNSIGDLKPNGNLAIFSPQNEGVGDIWVKVYTPRGKNDKFNPRNPQATGSIRVVVASAPSPTPTPPPTLKSVSNSPTSL